MNPRVATSAVRAPLSVSSALVPTVIPWAKPSTCAGVGAGALERGVDRRQHARATGRRASSAPSPCAATRPSKTTASVKVPPTSTPRSTLRTLSGNARGPGSPSRGLIPIWRPPPGGHPPRRSGPRRRPPGPRARSRAPRAGSPDRRSSPRDACATGSSRGPAAARAGRACPCGCARGTRGRPRRARRLGHPLQELERELDVAVDHHPDPQLVADREVHAHLVEQRARRAGEVAAVVVSRRITSSHASRTAACSRHPVGSCSSSTTAEAISR